jgi:hypothetical protein
VTKYDDIDDDLTPKFSRKEAGKGEQTLEPRAPEIQAMYDEVPLRLDSREFRVLDVLPGWRGSPIKCHLFSASSMLKINYEALSYVWGQSKEMKYKIEVNDCSMPVTTNLHNALQSLRYPDKSRLIWIDAICIDQRNITEKMTQLPMMGDIYRIAKRVCVYLGEADEESDYLLHVLEEHQDLQSPIGTKVQETPKWTATMDYLRANEDRIIHSLICLMHRQWFERLWIYQVSSEMYGCISALTALGVPYSHTRTANIHWQSQRIGRCDVWLSLRVPLGCLRSSFDLDKRGIIAGEPLVINCDSANGQCYIQTEV